MPHSDDMTSMYLDVCTMELATIMVGGGWNISPGICKERINHLIAHDWCISCNNYFIGWYVIKKRNILYIVEMSDTKCGK